MKVFALAVATAAMLFAVGPASAGNGMMHREGVQHSSSMNAMNRMMHREHRSNRRHMMKRHRMMRHRHGMH